jgi:glycosidase
MPKLNQQNRDTRAYFMDVAAHWLREFGIDGWRMDVARHIAPDFWVDFRRVCKAAKPDCMLLSEIWGNTSPWLQGDQFDGTMNYIFRDLCLEYFARARMDTRTFVDGITRMLSLYAPEITRVCQNLLSSHDTERFRTLADGDARRQHLATLFQLTMPGAPGIYYGDEIGLPGGHDPDCRRAFPWHAPQSWDTDLLEMTRVLLRIRRTHPALRLGTWRLLWAGKDSFAFERAHCDQQIVVWINRSQSTGHAALPLDVDTVTKLWGEGHATVQDQTLIITDSAPWSGLVLLGACSEEQPATTTKDTQ